MQSSGDPKFAISFGNANKNDKGEGISDKRGTTQKVDAENKHEEKFLHFCEV